MYSVSAKLSQARSLGGIRSILMTLILTLHAGFRQARQGTVRGSEK
ncbi:MAG: hypothetical protein ABWJ42_05000 [Sulfolobales archaeon]